MALAAFFLADLDWGWVVEAMSNVERSAGWELALRSIGGGA